MFEKTDELKCFLLRHFLYQTLVVETIPSCYISSVLMHNLFTGCQNAPDLLIKMIPVIIVYKKKREKNSAARELSLLCKKSFVLCSCIVVSFNIVLKKQCLAPLYKWIKRGGGILHDSISCTEMH